MNRSGEVHFFYVVSIVSLRRKERIQIRQPFRARDEDKLSTTYGLRSPMGVLWDHGIRANRQSESARIALQILNETFAAVDVVNLSTRKEGRAQDSKTYPESGVM